MDTTTTTTTTTTAVTPLAHRAILARLTCSAPTVTRRDAGAEAFTRSSLHDSALRVTTALFKDAASAPRKAIAAVDAVYRYHKEHTLPFMDRGARLLPNTSYMEYRLQMNDRIADVDNARAALLRAPQEYAAAVAADMAQRGTRASLSDYPDVQEFCDALGVTLTFSPLPQASHFLFDIDPADAQALQDQVAGAEDAAKRELVERLRAPLATLLTKLRTPIGAPGSVFRDSTVQACTDAIAMVEQLHMGDPALAALCEDVRFTLGGSTRHPDAMRAHPEVRQAVADRTAEAIAAIDSNTAWLFAA